jgi:hypothetical protein
MIGIFSSVNVANVQALLKSGGGPLRFYMFGLAPENVVYPYAVWRLISSTPENYLACDADIDDTLVQIDAYASESQGPTVVRDVVGALRSAIEGYAHITSMRGESRDPDTRAWRSGFDVNWFADR